MNSDEALSLIREMVYFYCDDHECENTECEDKKYIEAYELIKEELTQSLYYKECRDVWRKQAESLYEVRVDVDAINKASQTLQALTQVLWEVRDEHNKVPFE